MVTNKKPNNVSCSVVPDSLRPHVLKHTRPPSCPLPDPGVYPTHLHWVSDAIQPFHPLSPPFPPALNLSQSQGLFQWVGSSQQVAKVLELQHQAFQWIFRVDFLSDWLIRSPCSPRDSQESSPAPPFENINSLALSLLYSPTLTSIHDYWKSHSFDFGKNKERQNKTRSPELHLFPQRF